MSKPNKEILERLGTSALDAVPQTETGEVQPTEGKFDPYGLGNYKDPKNEGSQTPAGQSDKTGWGNQGNWGNEGYFQGFESRNEDRTKNGEPEPDLSEKAHETTKQRDKS